MPSIDYVPPVNADAEQALLSALLVNSRVYSSVAGTVQPEDFANPVHGLIYAAIEDVVARGAAATPVTVFPALQGHPDFEAADGRRLLARLAGGFTVLPNAAEYARIVADAARRRNMLAILHERIPDLSAGDLDTSCEDVVGDILAAVHAGGATSADMITASDAHQRVVDRLKSSAEAYSTGVPLLDAAMGGGLYPGKLYVLGAKQKAGKTLLLTTIAYNLIAKHSPASHAYLCLEMGATEIHQRIVARHLGFNSLNFLRSEYKNNVDFIAEVEQAADFFKGRGLYFLDRPRMTLPMLRQTIARAGLSGHITGLIVDYAQLVGGQRRGQSMAEHLDNVAQTLVEAAKQWNLWVMVAAQLNRDGEARGGDGLLNAADQVFYLKRKEEPGLEHLAWLEMRASRYTDWRGVGTEANPALQLDTGAGPHFRERN